MKIDFIKEKETKNTIRYAEEIKENGAAKIGTLYIKKEVVTQEKLGDKITVEVVSTGN